jgi:hypothetical protein
MAAGAREPKSRFHAQLRVRLVLFLAGDFGDHATMTDDFNWAIYRVIG